MRKVLIIGFVVLVAGAITYVLIQNPEIFRKIYLWLIGFFGLITWPLRKLWDWMNTNDDLKEISQNNKQLKLELEQIKKDLALAKMKLEEERRRNKVRITQLQSRISLEDQAGTALQKELAALKAQTPGEFRDSLPPAESRKLQDDMWKEVDFGL
jgi:hypothetical protein